MISSPLDLISNVHEKIQGLLAIAAETAPIVVAEAVSPSTTCVAKVVATIAGLRPGGGRIGGPRPGGPLEFAVQGGVDGAREALEATGGNSTGAEDTRARDEAEACVDSLCRLRQGSSRE